MISGETPSRERKISIIFPFHRGEKNLPILVERLYAMIKAEQLNCEIIAVNDGSRDRGPAIAREFAAHNPRFKVINFRVNAGQTAALRAGIDYATGDILVPMDSDLENDPRDIPRLLAKLDEGYDVVSGWRQTRWQGKFLTRKLPSMLANKLISKITGVPLHDYGCTLKAYRREVIEGIPLYGEMHRFIPAYAAWQGARVTEIPVSYERRKFGKSNYGIGRTFKVLLDLLLIRFLDRYMDRPIHFFGGIGFILFAAGLFTGTLAIVLRLFWGLHFVETPLPVVTALFLITGLNFLVMGIMSEMLMRIYYESKGAKQYRIKDTVNLE